MQELLSSWTLTAFVVCTIATIGLGVIAYLLEIMGKGE